METQIYRLKLVSPVCYVPINEPNPLDCHEGKSSPMDGNSGESNGARLKEKLYCFELEETQYLSIEPDGEKLMGRLVFSGEAGKNEHGDGKSSGEVSLPWEVKLPVGDYLFLQKHELLSREEIIALAIEIQQEGLWQRLVPGKLLYLRYLYEDGHAVTQLLRPFTER